MAQKDIMIIHEDVDKLLINKPAGVSVTADRSGASDIRQLLSRQAGQELDLRLVHRLDKDTSGVMLLAKNLAAQSFYSRCFAKHQARKVYIAIIRGQLPREQGFITAPISKSDKIQTVRIDSWRGKKAKTFYRVLLPMGSLTLIAAMPITGRTHQIRIHFAHKGFPLAIDPLYADNAPIYLSSFKSHYNLSRDQDEPSLIDRLTLHAYQLTIPGGPELPVQTFVAPLDKKFAATVKMLAKHTAANPKKPEIPEPVRAVIQGLPIPLDFSDEGIDLRQDDDLV